VTRRPAYSNLAEHPHAQDVRAVLARVPRLSDVELRGLAARWRNGTVVEEARSRALSPDTVLVVDILRAFDDIAALFADDLAGEADFCPVPPSLVSAALKAVRDAVAAVVARPGLSRGEYAALSAPWREVMGRPPEAGPSDRPAHRSAGAAVERLLATAVTLGTRCHDDRPAATYEGLLVRAMTRDEDEREHALHSAHTAAVLTGRRREWSLLRRDAARGVARRCGSCAVPAAAVTPAYDAERVTELVADAACGLLMSDVADDRVLHTLLAPLSGLVPLARPTSGA